MSEADLAVDKLRRIQQLWTELGRTKLNAPEYQTVLARIRILSAEYQAILDAAPKPK
jgi:hypothetical protein